jgi:hypothetical protein
MREEGESTGMMTFEAGTLLAGTLVRFPELWVGENISVHPAARQKTRMPNTQSAHKKPARPVFDAEITVLFIRGPRKVGNYGIAIISRSRSYLTIFL